MKPLEPSGLKTETESRWVPHAVAGSSERSLAEAERMYSNWLPKPPPDPDLASRLKRIDGIKVAAALAGVACYSALISGVFQLNAISAVAILFQFFGLGGLAVWYRIKTYRAAPDFTDFLDLPSEILQVPVDVQFFAGGVNYGSDQGVVSVVDGWVHFQGRRTNWSLHTFGAVHQHGTGGRVARTREGYVDKLRWEHRSGMFVVELLAYDRLDGLGKGLRNELFLALKDWSRCKEVTREPYVLPPTRPLPEVVERLQRIRGWVGQLRWVGLGLAAVATPLCFVGVREPFQALLNATVGVSYLLTLVGVIARASAGRALHTLSLFCDCDETPIKIRRRRGPGWLFFLDEWKG